MKWYTYLICFVLIVVGTFCGIQLYKEVKAESYINGSIDISNHFSQESFNYISSSVTFYNDIYDEKFIESEIDFKLVVETLKKEFGDELTEIYIDWLKGYKIKELIEKYKVKSCYYHIKKINEFIKIFLKNN